MYSVCMYMCNVHVNLQTYLHVYMYIPIQCAASQCDTEFDTYMSKAIVEKMPQM